jgi:hypothetical protein
MGNKIVTVFVPDTTVKSMQDEIEAGLVASAQRDAIAAYLELDDDGNVEVRSYGEDFDNGVADAIAFAQQSPGSDLLVIITDLVCDDPAKAEELLSSLTDDFVAIVTVSLQGYDKAWAKKLDDELPTKRLIDVIDAGELSNRETAYAEVGQWAGNNA